MTSTPDSEELNADPFAADIFAARGAGDENAETSETEANDEAVKPILWSANLPQVSRSTADWDALLRRLPPIFSELMPARLTDSLARLLDFPTETRIEFSASRKREINRAEDFAPDGGWWLSVGTAAEDAAEIFFQIEDALAVRLIDAALSEDAAEHIENNENIISRSLTATETAILEFLTLNLTHEANRVLETAQFRFRALSRKTPRALEKIFERDSFSLLALDGHLTGDLLPPTAVKVFLAPEALQSLQASGNGQPTRRAAVKVFHSRIKEVRARLFCGSAQLNFGELAALETGDVVLLENQELSVSGENLSGRAEIFLGEGARQKLTGNLSFSNYASNRGGAPFEESAPDADNKIAVRRINLNGARQITIESFAEIDAAFLDESMAETTDNSTNPNFPPDGETGEEQSGLAIENLAVALRVELEARRLTLAEVGNLRENQTLELGIRPTDEVNILIDDRVVGRGELVAVEDRLGVRITKLMR